MCHLSLCAQSKRRARLCSRAWKRRWSSWWSLRRAAKCCTRRTRGWRACARAWRRACCTAWRAAASSRPTPRSTWSRASRAASAPRLTACSSCARSMRACTVSQSQTPTASAPRVSRAKVCCFYLTLFWWL